MEEIGLIGGKRNHVIKLTSDEIVRMLKKFVKNYALDRLFFWINDAIKEIGAWRIR